MKKYRIIANYSDHMFSIGQIVIHKDGDFYDRFYNEDETEWWYCTTPDEERPELEEITN